MKKIYVNGLLICVVETIITLLSGYYFDVGIFFVLVMINQLLFNPMMIVIYDFIINPSVIHSKYYYILVIFTGVVVYFFKVSVMSIGGTWDSILYTTLFLLQVFFAYFLKREKVSKYVYIPILIVFPLVLHWPIGLLMFAFLNMAHY